MTELLKPPLDHISPANASDLSNCTDKLNNDFTLASSSPSLHIMVSLVFTGISLSSYSYTMISLLLSGELLHKRRYFSTFNYCLCLFINCMINKMCLLVTSAQLKSILSTVDLFTLSSAYTWILIQGYLVYETVILTKHFSLLVILCIGYLTPVKIIIASRYLNITEIQYTWCMKCPCSGLTQFTSTWFFVIPLAAAQLIFSSLLVYALNGHWKDRVTETSYTRWTVISWYITFTTCLGALSKHFHLSSCTWFTLVATVSSSLTGPLVFILEVLTNRRLLSTLSVAKFYSQSTLSSAGEWYPGETSIRNRTVVTLNESKAAESECNPSPSPPLTPADSTSIPLAPGDSVTYRAEKYAYM